MKRYQISGKNKRRLAGVPLVTHAIRAAQQASVFDQVIVTSDDPEILAMARQEGATDLLRPPELSQDNSSIVDVLFHVADFIQLAAKQVEAFCLLPPTSPLRTSSQIARTAQAFCEGNWKSAVSLTPLDHAPQKSVFIQNGETVPLCSFDDLHRNRQDLPKCYRQSGHFWFSNWASFLSTSHLINSPCLPIEMEKKRSIDIDTIDDFFACEAYLSESLHHKLS